MRKGQSKQLYKEKRKSYTCNYRADGIQGFSPIFVSNSIYSNEDANNELQIAFHQEA